MSQPLQTLTCPSGHTFPYEQLTVRDGLSVCPICDRAEWAKPRPMWSPRLLANPVVLVAFAVLVFGIEAMSGIGIGLDYRNLHIAGAGWLVAGSAVIIAGVIVVIVGLMRLAARLRSRRWVRTMLTVPLAIVALGTAVVAVGDLAELGLNIGFVNASDPGAGWQITAQVFDILFFAGLAAAIGWAAALTRRPDRTEPQALALADNANLDAAVPDESLRPSAPDGLRSGMV